MPSCYDVKPRNTLDSRPSGPKPRKAPFVSFCHMHVTLPTMAICFAIFSPLSLSLAELTCVRVHIKYSQVPHHPSSTLHLNVAVRTSLDSWHLKKTSCPHEPLALVFFFRPNLFPWQILLLRSVFEGRPQGTQLKSGPAVFSYKRLRWGQSSSSAIRRRAAPISANLGPRSYHNIKMRDPELV